MANETVSNPASSTSNTTSNPEVTGGSKDTFGLSDDKTGAFVPDQNVNAYYGVVNPFNPTLVDREPDSEKRAAKAGEVEVELLSDSHTHAGRIYTKGDKFLVDDASARWIVANKIGKKA